VEGKGGNKQRRRTATSQKEAATPQNVSALAGCPGANPRHPPHFPLIPRLGLTHSRAAALSQSCIASIVPDLPPNKHVCFSPAPSRTTQRSSREPETRDGRPRRRLHGRLRREAARAPLRGLLRRHRRQQQRVARVLREDVLRRAGAVVGAAVLGRHLPSARGRRHRGADPVQGVQGVREAREELDQEAHRVAEEVRARQRPRARHQRHHREDQAPVRELRQVRAAVRRRRPAAPHRQRRPAALGRVRHPGPALPLHRRLDRVGRQELPHRHQRREEARHEGDHHRRRARHPPPPQGVHLARRRLPRAHQRGPRRRRQGHRLLLAALVHLLALCIYIAAAEARPDPMLASDSQASFFFTALVLH
jgi:hypothetical protein